VEPAVGAGAGVVDAVAIARPPTPERSATSGPGRSSRSDALTGVRGNVLAVSHHRPASAEALRA
jgi:hypothetical protein